MLDIAFQHLSSFHELNEVLDNEWLSKELKKPQENWGTIVRWLASVKTYEKHCRPCLEELNETLAFLHAKIDAKHWQKLKKKLQTSVGENTNGALAELSFCVFLAEHNLNFDMEVKLGSGNKNVDFSISSKNASSINVEVHCIKTSDREEKISEDIAYKSLEVGKPLLYNLPFSHDNHRIKGKIEEKMKKFVVNEITVVAFDITDNSRYTNDIVEVASEVLSNPEEPANQLVDGIIWFERIVGSKLLPGKRKLFLNPSSPFRDDIKASPFVKLWQI